MSVCMAQHSAGENVTTTVQRYANLDTQLAKWTPFFSFLGP